MLDSATTTPRPGARPLAAARRARARVAAVVLAVLAAAGVHLTWFVFVATRSGQHVDAMALEGAQHGRDTLWHVARPVLDVVSVTFVVVGIAAAMVVAMLRRRWALALQVAVLVAGANVTTQVLKYSVYPRPSLLPGWTGANALPSGHTTVAASVAAALLLVVPRTWRPLVAVLGAVWTAATGVSTLVGQWHRPSDVVAAVLVVLAWAAGICAVRTRSSLDVVGPGGRATRGATAVAAGLLGLAGVGTGAVAAIALVDLGVGVRGIPFGGDVTAYAGGVAGVVAVTSVAFALLLLVRQATSRPEDRVGP
ncbi:MAG: phosphatase PAP2 family protein [Promicromonosporaceae bacterium]|nr:phosphatase PAP2 family protein [Promicromonosporaceae bacterium]